MSEADRRVLSLASAILNAVKDMGLERAIQLSVFKVVQTFS